MTDVMEEQEEKAVCLACLKYFDEKPNLTGLFDCNEHQKLYKRFQHFAREHLRLSPKVLQRLNSALASVVGSDKRPVFCDECEDQLIIICNLYDGLCEVKKQLATKVGQWGVFLGSKKGEEKNKELMKTLATRMKLEGDMGVEEMRNQIVTKCKLKAICDARSTLADSKKVQPQQQQQPPNLLPKPPVLIKAPPKPILISKPPHQVIIKRPILPKPPPQLQQEPKIILLKTTPAPTNNKTVLIKINKDGGIPGIMTNNHFEPIEEKKEPLPFKIPVDIEMSEVTETDFDDGPIKPHFEGESKRCEENDGSDYEGDLIIDVFDPLSSTAEGNPLNNGDFSSPSLNCFQKESETVFFKNEGGGLNFIDESDNNGYEDEFRGQESISMPLDVTIEEEDGEYAADWSSDSSPSGIKIVGVTGSNHSTPMASPSKTLKRKKKEPVAPLDPNNIPDDTSSFVRFFKKRRQELGLTQSDVSRLLGNTFGHEDELFSQTTVSRFEAMNLSRKNMEKLRPLFEKWLKGADPRTSANEEPPEPIQKRRKRTTIEKDVQDTLDAYFLHNQRPDSEELRQLAQQVNVDREVVRVWFCNKRQKLKKVTTQQGNTDSLTYLDPNCFTNSFQNIHQLPSPPVLRVLPQQTVVQQQPPAMVTLLNVNSFTN